MKKTRFTETQIVKAIQEHENSRDANICCELQITTAGFLQIAPALWNMKTGHLFRLQFHNIINSTHPFPLTLNISLSNPAK